MHLAVLPDTDVMGPMLIPLGSACWFTAHPFSTFPNTGFGVALRFDQRVVEEWPTTQDAIRRTGLLS